MEKKLKIKKPSSYKKGTWKITENNKIFVVFLNNNLMTSIHSKNRTVAYYEVIKQILKHFIV